VPLNFRLFTGPFFVTDRRKNTMILRNHNL
jgi:hypothetical protein